MSRQEAGHRRQVSAISTAAAIRSSSASPSASPISPGVDIEGLSRRLSWNRHQNEPSISHSLSVPETNHTSHNGGLGVGPIYSPSRSPPLEELDIGLGDYQRRSEEDLKASYPPPRPYFYNYQSTSQASFDSSTSDVTPPENEHDRERLTFTSAQNGSNHRRVPSKAYDENGNPRMASMSSRISGAVSRNHTLRNMSRSIRQAGGRVVSMIGHEDQKGRVRIDDGDGESLQMDYESVRKSPMEQGGERDKRPNPMPPEPSSHLRGKTLGIFGPNSRTRIALDRLMRFP